MSAVATIDGVVISHSGSGPYTARSASNRDPDWPFWIVVDSTGFNGIKFAEKPTAKLMDRESAELIAEALNATLPDQRTRAVAGDQEINKRPRGG